MNWAELREAGIHCVGAALDAVAENLRTDAEFAFREVTLGGRSMLLIDAFAEHAFASALKTFRKRRFSHIHVLGEERLKSKDVDLTDAPGLFALVDAIDGTDLVVRDLSNWCSAVVFFEPRAKPGKRILGAFVALPSRQIYFSTADMSEVRVQASVRNKDRRRVRGTSGKRAVTGASLCFYGQKLSNLMSTAEYVERLSQHLGPSADTLRIYNLAGIPLMMKLIDHSLTGARGIDAVFDLKGQRAHDVVPGAYLALKAGAAVRRENGTDCTLRELEQLLLRPAANETRLRYFIAATSELADELCQI